VTIIYLDNNATTKVADEVAEEMVPYLTELYGNPSSMHTFGGNVQKAVTRARERIAALLGADVDEIIFTSCGTESDNTALRGVLEANPDKRHIVTTRVEHPAVLNVAKHLSERGYRLTTLSVDSEARLNLDEYRDALSDETALVSVMWANNEVGAIYPVEELARVAKARGIPFHTDAVQAAGKIPINLADSAIDLLSISGHKLHAPKGIGVLYVRRGTRVSPLMLGGHQERGRRGGTENTASIVALGKACELASDALDEENTRVRALRDKLEAELLARCPDSRRNGAEEPRLPNTSNIAFAYVEGEAILLHLDEDGICASSGSACTSGSLEPSHVLRAMGVPYTMVHGSVRFSLSRYTTEAEIEKVIEVFPPLIENLREISPFVST